MSKKTTKIQLNDIEKQIKLDLIDKKILFQLDLNSRIPATKLAKIVNVSRETCKYRINKLISQGIIEKFIVLVNPNKLGYKMYKLHIQLTNIGEEREKFFEFLAAHPNVYWMGICDGAWDLILTLFAKDATHLYDIINDFLYKYRHIIARKVVGTFVDAYVYKKSFFTNEIAKVDRIGGKVINNIIDNVDKDIIKTLSNNARMPITDLAIALNTTAGRLRHRLKRLEKKGIILGYRTQVNLNKLNLETFKALIYFNYVDKKREKTLLEYLRQNPNTSYYVRVISPWEGEVEFIVKTYKEFNKTINDLRKRFSDLIKNYESVIISKEAWHPGLFKPTTQSPSSTPPE
jgi:DNA-binding Lrp family transcriptional regulator